MLYLCSFICLLFSSLLSLYALPVSASLRLCVLPLFVPSRALVVGFFLFHNATFLCASYVAVLWLRSAPLHAALSFAMLVAKIDLMALLFCGLEWTRCFAIIRRTMSPAPGLFFCLSAALIELHRSQLLSFCCALEYDLFFCHASALNGLPAIADFRPMLHP